MSKPIVAGSLVVTACLCGLSVTATAQSKYSDSKYGISLVYPKDFELKQGDLDKDDPGLGYLGPIPMEFVAPGGMGVVTLRTRAGSHPGTDLDIAFFTVSINQNLAKDKCEQFPDDISGVRKPISKEVSGIEFHGLEQGEAGLGHQFGGTYFHGFAGGSCFELGYGIATSGLGSVDGLKPVNQKEVFSILEHILESVTISRR